MRFSFLTFRFPFVWLILCQLGLASCSQKIIAEDQESIIIRNHSSRAIHSLLVKPCSKPYEEFEQMGKDLKPGSITLIRLYSGCFDADALDEKGEPMATQYKLRLPPQLRWDVY